MEWIFNGAKLEEVPEGYQGFVYIITDLVNNKKYLGKKNFWFMKTKQVNKKKKRFKAESDWKEYYGSNDELKAIVADRKGEGFTREIIRLCKMKSEMGYWETKLLFEYDVLLHSDIWYNAWVSCKINRNQLAKMIKEMNTP